jgi:dTDP-4-dehydrorhamnose reductase
MTARLLVIGGGGFLGSRVLRAAVAQGIACASFGPAGRDMSADLDVARFGGDAQDSGALAAALAAFRPEAVIWAAGYNPTGDGLARTAESDVARAVAVNAGAFAATLAACAACGVARVVQCGSTVVFGPASDYRATRVDEAAPPAPRTAYGLTKRRNGRWMRLASTSSRCACPWCSGRAAGTPAPPAAMPACCAPRRMTRICRKRSRPSPSTSCMATTRRPRC